MARDHATGAVLVFNPSGVNMDLEENPRRGKKRKNGGKKRRKAHRANPKRRRKAHRSNPSHASAPVRHKRRRRARSNPSRRHRYHARRRNPSFPSVMSIATWTAGGAVAYGADYLVRKIPGMSVPVSLGARAAAGIVVGVGVSMLSEKAGAGAFGALGFQLPGMLLEGYNYWQATQAADKKTATPAAPGAKGIDYGNGYAARYARR